MTVCKDDITIDSAAYKISKYLQISIIGIDTLDFDNNSRQNLQFAPKITVTKPLLETYKVFNNFKFDSDQQRRHQATVINID